MIVDFLDRRKFPNGNVEDLWEQKDLIHNTEVVILHNNWALNMKDKIVRLLKQNLWFYDKDALICRYEDVPLTPMEFANDPAFGGEAE